MVSRTLSAIGLLFFFFAASPAFALDIAGPAPIQYTVSPENPAPNSTVYIQLDGIGNILGNSMIIWSQDGTVVAQGYGLSSHSFTMGGLGSQTTVTIEVDSATQGAIIKTFTFNPSLVSLVWEGHTSIPPFFAGKPLASPGSMVTVFAFPTVHVGGAAQPASSLSFQWRLNDQAMPAQSGIGRSSFTFISNQLHQSEDVSVSVYTQNGTAAGSGSVTIPLTQPRLVFYVHDPLRGILYQSALPNSFTMPGTEVTVRAEPFYFSTSGAGGVQYSWQINGEDTSGPNTAQGELTLRQTGSGAGSATLSVALQNTDPAKLLQAAQSTLTVLFGQTNASTGLFGL